MLFDFTTPAFQMTGESKVYSQGGLVAVVTSIHIDGPFITGILQGFIHLDYKGYSH